MRLTGIFGVRGCSVLRLVSLLSFHRRLCGADDREQQKNAIRVEGNESGVRGAGTPLNGSFVAPRMLEEECFTRKQRVAATNVPPERPMLSAPLLSTVRNSQVIYEW